MSRIASVALLTALLVSNSSHAKHSGSGRSPPRKLSERQIGVLEEFVPLIPAEYDPIEIVALAMVETGLTPAAISWTGDYGILQVNCKIHAPKMKKVFGFEDCKKDMLDMKKNVKASLYIFTRMRTLYRGCRRKKVYACYNGGPGWKVVMRRCLESCEGKACRKCNRPARYADSVKKHIRFLNRKYRDLIYSLSNRQQQQPGISK